MNNPQKSKTPTLDDDMATIEWILTAIPDEEQMKVYAIFQEATWLRCRVEYLEQAHPEERP